MSMSATKRIAKNFSWLLVGNTISGVIKFITIVYLARVLQAGSFGLFTFAQAFLMYLVLVVDAGFSMLGTCEIARQKQEAAAITLNIFVLRIMMATIIFLLSALILFLVPITSSLRLLFIFTFLFVFYRALNADWVFQGLEKMEYISLAKVLFSVFSFALVFYFVRAPQDLLAAPLIQSVCGIAVAVIFLLILSRFILPLRFFDLDRSLWQRYLLMSLPLAASVIMMQVYVNLDTIMLGFMNRPQVVGYYNAAYQIFFVFLGLFSIWQATAIPVITKKLQVSLAEAKVFLQKYLRLTLLLVVPAVVLVALLAPLIINLVFGPHYVPAILALRILIWVLIPVVIGSTYGILILIPAGFFNHYLAAVTVGAVVNIIFNFLLIPPFSFAGAAAATILADVSAGLVSFCFVRKVLALSFLPYLFKPLLIVLAGGLAYIFIYPCGLLLAGLFYLLAGAAVLLLLEGKFVFSFVEEILVKK